MVILKKQIAGASAAALTRFVASARKAAKLRGNVTVLITSNLEMRKLNHRFRKKDEATDVLSFPTDANPYDSSAGDLAISADIARENAKKLGHPVSQEIKVLILHGILHLAGYDHEIDSGEMARVEQRLRKKLRLPVSLIQRSEAISKGDNRSNPRMKTLRKAKRLEQRSKRR
ncbi:MAG TPA: rRNA maturation RNase YbeY [Candidatus Kapabacteria bacterium]|nr:rRNA maturation RNase YbeY [Candidatus Kapabacteria bacterium]